MFMEKVFNSKSLIYILNTYSSKSSEHYYHIINLLNVLSTKSVRIILVIEKCDEIPYFQSNLRTIVISKSKSHSLFRYLKLYFTLLKLYHDGYTNVFIRISSFSTLCAISASFFSKLKVYYWHSGTVFEFDDKQPLTLKKVAWFFKTRLPFNIIKHTVDYFVTGPESMINYYHNVVSVPLKKLRLLYNDIDISRFNVLSIQNKKNLRTSLGLDPDDFVFLFVHRFSPVRMSSLYLPVILDVFFTHVNDTHVKFIFIGSGPDKTKIQTSIINCRYSNQVLFKGNVPNSVIQNYYMVSDVYFNPTHAECFPRTILEAMACSLPIVTTNAGGISDILPIPQLPYISDIDDVDSFADNLISIFQNRNSLSSIRLSNRNAVMKYSTDYVSDMFKNILNI